MRTGTITIDGKKHLLCFSVRVVRACAERYGSVEGLWESLASDDPVKALDESMWALSAMMNAGDKYAKDNAIDNAPTMSVDQLYDSCDVSDFINIKAAIIETVNNGRRTTVEAEPPKNAETTLGK